jgi:hypothetical protein
MSGEALYFDLDEVLNRWPDREIDLDKRRPVPGADRARPGQHARRRRLKHPARETRSHSWP